MTPHALLFTIACIGISEAVYLIKIRRGREKPVCILGQDCHKVLESRYNKLLGVHNDVLGLFFYIAITLVTAFLVIGLEPKESWELIAKLIILGGALMSLALVYIQWRVIKIWCFWCLMSALTVLFMGLIVLVSKLII